MKICLINHGKVTSGTVLFEILHNKTKFGIIYIYTNFEKGNCYMPSYLLMKLGGFYLYSVKFNFYKSEIYFHLLNEFVLSFNQHQSFF